MPTRNGLEDGLEKWISNFSNDMLLSRVETITIRTGSEGWVGAPTLEPKPPSLMTKQDTCGSRGLGTGCVGIVHRGVFVFWESFIYFWLRWVSVAASGPALVAERGCYSLLWYMGFFGFPGGSDGKVSACKAGDLGSIPGSGRSPGEGNGYLLQNSCLENAMDGAAW